VFGLEHIAVDADVGVNETLFEKGRFARALDADENNRFHRLL
jgi:hypothetical protein